jgi:hypothetical protein
VHPQADDDADDADAGGAPSLPPSPSLSLSSLSLSPLRGKMQNLISPNLWLQQDATSFCFNWQVEFSAVATVPAANG